MRIVNRDAQEIGEIIIGLKRDQRVTASQVPHAIEQDLTQPRPGRRRVAQRRGRTPRPLEGVLHQIVRIDSPRRKTSSQTRERSAVLTDQHLERLGIHGAQCDERRAAMSSLALPLVSQVGRHFPPYRKRAIMFVEFMRSTTGRAARIIAGAAIVVVGLAAVRGPAGV